MARYFRLEDAMPLLRTIEAANKDLVKVEQKALRYHCEKCQRYHWVYSNIGNEHRDYRVTQTLE